MKGPPEGIERPSLQRGRDARSSVIHLVTKNLSPRKGKAENVNSRHEETRMAAMIDHALQYAGRGWPVFRLSGHKTPLKGSHGHLDAATNPAIITSWWTEKPRANIGLATGAIVVLDLDGPDAIRRLTALAAPHGGLPPTLTARTARGVHLYYQAPAGVSIRTRNEPRKAKGADGIDIKGTGGYVVLPPSVNVKSSFIYQWLTELPLSEMPAWLHNWCQTIHGKEQLQNSTFGILGQKPAYLQSITNINQPHLTTRASVGLTPWSPEEEERIWSALSAIPARGYDNWRTIGMALQSLDWVRQDGTSPGFELFDDWSATEGEQYSLEATEKKWNSFGKRSGIGIGTLFHIAEQHGWTGNLPQEYVELPSIPFVGVDLNVNGFNAGPTLTPAAFTAPNHESPLIELNQKYATIGDVGGKCLVMGWVASKVDEAVRVPSFQAFKAFAERHANRYVKVRKPSKVEGEEPVFEPAQLGATWLKWRQRRTYEGIDLAPNGEPVLPGNVLNLWSGFGVAPTAGRWDRMKQHIGEVLAQGNAESMTYIMKWAAWAVQHPGERAEAALVFKGGKGSGKGSFANALRRVFGPHGLSVSNSKHLVGAFNGHLRNCLLLFADEAFWAGDKQGESVLKAILTEPALMIEQKGVDASPWKNRLHCIMAANAQWVVPASHDERRYAVFEVSSKRIRDETYFQELHDEMRAGGLSAMLHDLQQVNLNGWHPRRVLQTEALQQQKLRSLDPRHEWFEGLLQDGLLPASGVKDAPLIIPASYLLHQARESTPRMKDISSTALGLFLRDMGCVKIRGAKGTGWRFMPLSEARSRWGQVFGRWAWDHAEVQEWGSRN